MTGVVCLGIFILLFGKADGCLFPTDLNGEWLSSSKSLLNITSSSTTTTISGYSTDEFVGVSSLDCHLKFRNKYVFRSASIPYLGVNFYVYVCFVLTRQTSTKYIYHLGSVENADANNERLKSYTTISVTPITVDLICDRSSFAAGTEHVLLKNDGTEANSKIMFPDAFQGTWNYTYNSGSGQLCGNGSDVNICSASDASSMTYNYTTCATIQAYSATGVLYAMWNTSDSNYMYVHVYNTDSSTDESTTYRFTCYVAALHGSQLYATQNPKQCLSTQTSTAYTAPGAALVYTMIGSCGDTGTGSPSDDAGTVLAMASTVGLVVSLVILVGIVICAVLLWFYHKKRKEKRALDKIPLQKTQPANKRLTNGDINKRSHVHEHDSIAVPKENGDITLDIDTDPDIRRENSICVSMASRGNSAVTGLMCLDGPAPVEEPDKVNRIVNQAIVEEPKEGLLASTFLPISPAETERMHHTDVAIQKLRNANRDSDNDDDKYDMDDIDDELGLPRLSGAFTPTIQPEPAPFPVLMYKKESQPNPDDKGEITATGVLKVQLKKRIQRRKFRISSSKSKSSCKRTRPKSGITQKKENMVFNFMTRIKNGDQDKIKEEAKEKIENQLKNEISSSVDKEAVKARVAKKSQRESRYLVDAIRDKGLRSANERVGRTSSSDQRRRFGDPPVASAGRYRKKTPRLRHPMEIQADNEGTPDQKEIREKVPSEPDAKRDRTRSGRRRAYPESTTIPSVKEDPFDHQERPTTTSAFSEARNGRSAGLWRSVNHSFLTPPMNPVDEDVWNKVSHMWKDNTTYSRPSQFSNLVRQ